ncbi:DEKNAAC104346 [Brettanomyces naardenensis]|uniref:DEKNAAC104346 n=1 Tax=Brettanomyces naardenensis TaxID=13370 RepID=A0A448YQP1_BRENA|nr:DEKNAAC104346 [Brettanomyces naardenensis]
MASLNLSEESKERLAKILDTTRSIVHYSWIPFILYLGWQSTSTKPNFVQLVSPFPSA